MGETDIHKNSARGEGEREEEDKERERESGKDAYIFALTVWALGTSVTDLAVLIRKG